MTVDKWNVEVPFGALVAKEVARIRELLKCDESMYNFVLRIDAEGRLHSGEVKITFTVSPTSYVNDEAVSGHNFNTIVEELLRRRGWNAVNTPLALSYDGKIKTADEESMNETPTKDVSF